ncbi:MAG: aconitate hydratase [Marinifilaceae bacterium]|jgi:aconitate hydratase|nr:aconitate hydratase [Marinifilaceae bacterium]
MLIDFNEIKQLYEKMFSNLQKAKKKIAKPLSISEKILYSHLWDTEFDAKYIRGKDYVYFRPDRVAMQDATAQMALLQFIKTGLNKTTVPTTVHCDHLILANKGAEEDLQNAKKENNEIYDFLKDVSRKKGIGFWEPGSGIIHQVILENYAIPGSMLIGTDSHTVNAGGLGMLAIGVGGADAVDVMVDMPWELKLPKLIGVKLTGSLSRWAAPKDVILKLAGILTVKGGTDCIIEYFGDGAKSISCTGKATICNMGAEIGATTSIFDYDSTMTEYLTQTSRSELIPILDNYKDLLTSDKEIIENPENFYDQYIEINLDELEPHVNGPFTPDLARPISEFVKHARLEKYPLDLEVGLIGSCTNSSYEDLSRAASIAKQARENNIKAKSEFIITPGSEMIRATTERDNILQEFEKIGGVIMSNACGPCIGQWKRHNIEGERKNSIITSFNRNFAKRNDGNPNTYAFVASPEIVTAMSLSGRLDFNPMEDSLKTEDNKEYKLFPPIGDSFPKNGFEDNSFGYVHFEENPINQNISIDEKSKRLAFLPDFQAWDNKDIEDLALLIKVKGKCTTDHISMAGPWLRFRGHLDNISNNLLIGAINSFNDKPNSVFNIITGQYDLVPNTARALKSNNISSIIVAEDNYGEGSSREHAAMEPRHLGVKVVLVKSFARIHETNLKKQGVLALSFNDSRDYDKIREDDKFDILNMTDFKPGSKLVVKIKHSDGESEKITVNHSFSANQIEWFKYGSALNLIKNKLA